MPATMLSSFLVDLLPDVTPATTDLLGGSYVGTRVEGRTTVQRPDGSGLPRALPCGPGLFGWADDTAGTRELAQALLVDALRRQPTAGEVRAFTRHVVASLPADEFTLPHRTIGAWANRRLASLAA